MTYTTITGIDADDLAAKLNAFAQDNTIKVLYFAVDNGIAYALVGVAIE